MLYGRAWRDLGDKWDRMVIKKDREAEFKKIAEYAVQNRPQYFVIEENTNVPWAMIACIHKRESDAQDKRGNPLFTSYLGNGQPLKKRTTIEPIGRGPFPDFESGAIDALEYDKFTLVQEWRLEKQLYYMWLFNGFGQAGIPTPYLWGGTNIQKPGKWIRDHVYDPNVWDGQPGCAPMLWMIWQVSGEEWPQRED